MISNVMAVVVSIAVVTEPVWGALRVVRGVGCAASTASVAKDVLAGWDAQLAQLPPYDREEFRMHPPVEVLEATFDLPSPRVRRFRSSYSSECGLDPAADSAALRAQPSMRCHAHGGVHFSISRVAPNSLDHLEEHSPVEHMVVQEISMPSNPRLRPRVGFSSKVQEMHTVAIAVGSGDFTPPLDSRTSPRSTRSALRRSRPHSEPALQRPSNLGSDTVSWFSSQRDRCREHADPTYDRAHKQETIRQGRRWGTDQSHPSTGRICGHGITTVGAFPW